MLELPPPDPSMEIVAASRGYSKGLAQTDGGQLLLRGELELGAWFAAAQWKNVDTQGASGEATASVGVAGEVGGFTLEGTAGHKWLTGLDAPADGDAFEFTASASRAFGRLTPRIALTFSPDDLGATRTSLYAEAGLSFRLAAGTRLGATLGRRERGGGDDYTAFGASLAQDLGEHVVAELRYNDSAQSARGDAYEARLVAALRLRF